MGVTDEESAPRQSLAEPTVQHGGGSRGWVGIAVNEAAGAGRGRTRVERLARALSRHGFAVRIAATIGERHELVSMARDDPRAVCLVAAGGDGTISSLVNEHPACPVTVLPVGTENLFARHFQLPRQPENLAQVIAGGHVARIDLGRAAGRNFALMAGIGFDADVVTRHHDARLNRSGLPRPTHRAAYFGPVLQASWFYRFPQLEIRILEPAVTETLSATTAILFNLPRYALGLPFAPAARENDGWLDLVLFQKPGPFNALRYLWLVFRRIHLREPGVSHHRVRRVEFTSREPVPIQFDGDPMGAISTAERASQPWIAEVIPGALEVLVPATRRLAHAG